jgi:DltD C-terminal region.
MAHPPDQLLLLKTALKRSPGPAAVVYELTPIGIASSPKSAERLRSQHVDYFRNSFMGSCIWSDWDKFQQLDTFLNRSFYLVRYQPLFKDMFNSSILALTHSEDALLKQPSVAATGEVSRKGWTPGYPMINSNQLAYMLSKRDTRESSMCNAKYFQHNDPDYKPLADVFEFCRSKQIPLMLVTIPLHPEYQKQQEAQLLTNSEELSSLYQTVADKAEAEFLDLKEVDEPSYFFDIQHLNAVGAVALSEKISSALTTTHQRLINRLSLSRPMLDKVPPKATN